MEMISEFQQLAQKVDQLAALIQAMRGENSDLRRQVVELTATNTELEARIQQAHDRVTIVLDKLPHSQQGLA